MEKDFWRQIVTDSFAVPTGHSAANLLPELMTALGATDPELRDTLCYEILCAWVEKGEFAPEHLRAMMAQLLANLQEGIGQGETDLVFLRTFSVLILGEIIAYDRQAPFLTAAEFAGVVKAAIRYLSDETDLRGYVPDKGWAHSAAHTADLLRRLAANPRSGAADLMAILEAIGAKMLAPTQHAYVDKEEYRLGLAVLAVLRRERLPVMDVAAWIKSLGGNEERARSFTLGRDNVRYSNLNSFLLALHVMIAYQEPLVAEKEVLLAEIHAALGSYNPRFV